jgi:glycine hydroxymethyltransferase
MVSGGTDNHLILLDLRSVGIDGARLEKVLEHSSIAANKNTVPGDKSAMAPKGMRVGTPAMTSRGLEEDDFVKVADFINRGIDITKYIMGKAKTKKLKDFNAALNGQDWPQIQELREEVEEFATSFPTIGF